jgi:hypothetical protein
MTLTSVVFRKARNLSQFAGKSNKLLFYKLLKNNNKFYFRLPLDASVRFLYQRANLPVRRCAAPWAMLDLNSSL